MKTLGLFGGTFDPIHFGHLRMALELREHFQLDAMHLLPSHQPPHRDDPHCSSEDRAAMVELALNHCPGLKLDKRELYRDSPSYMIDTLADVRTEVGDQVSIILAMGMDSLATLDNWHRWQSLLDFAHLLVVSRPGYQPPSTGLLAEFIAAHHAEKDQLINTAHGSIVFATMTLLPVSATAIRQMIGAGQSPQFLLPDNVWHYIQKHRLYGFTEG